MTVATFSDTNLRRARSAHPNANVMNHKSTSDASAPTSDMDVDARVAGMG